MTTHSSETARRAQGRNRLAAAASQIAERDAGNSKAAYAAAPAKVSTVIRSRAPAARATAPPAAAQTVQTPAAPVPPVARTVAVVQEEAPAWQPQGFTSPSPPADHPAYSPPAQRPPPVSDSKADAAFTLGIISIFLNVLFVPGILAIVWGGRERHENAKARTGFICGIVGTALSARWALLIIMMVVGTASAVNTAVNNLPATTPVIETPGAAAPATPASPTKAVYNIGDTARTGDFAVTVYGFKNPQPSTNTFIQPDPGMRYVSVDVQMTNSDSKTQRSFSSILGFHLVDAQNRQYDIDIMDAGLNPGAPDGMIASGQSVRGFVAFEVPNGATGLKLRVQGNLTAAGALFNLASTRRRQ